MVCPKRKSIEPIALNIGHGDVSGFHYDVRRNEAARKSHARTWRAKHRGLKVHVAVERFTPLDYHDSITGRDVEPCRAGGA